MSAFTYHFLWDCFREKVLRRPSIVAVTEGGGRAFPEPTIGECTILGVSGVFHCVCVCFPLCVCVCVCVCPSPPPWTAPALCSPRAESPCTALVLCTAQGQNPRAHPHEPPPRTGIQSRKQLWDLPCPSFPCFFLGVEEGKENHKRNKDFINPYPRKFLEKKGKTFRKKTRICLSLPNPENPLKKKGKSWWEEECRAASWRKDRFFEILFAARIGKLAGFAEPPGRHSWLNPCAVLDFYVDIFGDQFPATFVAAEKRALKIRGNFRRKKSAICWFVAGFFAPSFAISGHPYFEQCCTYKSKKFGRNPFCEKFPLRKSLKKNKVFLARDRKNE